MTKMKVVRITKDEYELEDGTICPMMFEFEEGELPSLEEFQGIYDNNFDLVQRKYINDFLTGQGLIEKDFKDYDEDGLPEHGGIEMKHYLHVTFDEFESKKEDIKYCTGDSYYINGDRKYFVIWKGE